MTAAEADDAGFGDVASAGFAFCAGFAAGVAAGFGVLAATGALFVAGFAAGFFAAGLAVAGWPVYFAALAAFFAGFFAATSLKSSFP